jgi:hypothetical protein
MEKLGRILQRVAPALAIIVVLAAFPVARHHAHLQSTAAHQRWGSAVTGTVVGFMGSPSGDVGSSYRPVVIKFLDRTGKSATRTRLMYWKTAIGDTFPVWQSIDGKVFVNHDMEIADKGYRTEPFPVGLGTYVWRLVIFGIAALITGFGGAALGEALEEAGRSRRRKNFKLAA